MKKMIYLCGLQSSGKTSVGQLLAEELSWNFIDTDRQIEKNHEAITGKHQTCREIFQKNGETKFREFEQQQIEQTAALDCAVVSLGGGTLENPYNAKHIQKHGIAIYLSAPLDLLWERIILRGMPSYLNPNDPKQHFFSIARQRIPIFEAVASKTIYTENLSICDIVMDITYHMNNNDPLHHP